MTGKRCLEARISPPERAQSLGHVRAHRPPGDGARKEFNAVAAASEQEAAESGQAAEPSAMRKRAMPRIPSQDRDRPSSWIV